MQAYRTKIGERLTRHVITKGFGAAENGQKEVASGDAIALSQRKEKVIPQKWTAFAEAMTMCVLVSHAHPAGAAPFRLEANLWSFLAGVPALCCHISFLFPRGWSLSESVTSAYEVVAYRSSHKTGNATADL
jgi:hypothetical protein